MGASSISFQLEGVEAADSPDPKGAPFNMVMVVESE